MKSGTILLVLFAGLLAIFSGCSAGGAFLAQNVTNVDLSESNFEIVARNVEGFSKAEYILGFSFSNGAVAWVKSPGR